MRSFSDEFKVGVLLIVSCVVGLYALYQFHLTPVLPFSGFPAKVVAVTLMLSLILTTFIHRRTMQDEAYGSPVALGTGPDAKKQSES